MAVSYNRLWKLLVDRKMSKADLRKQAEIAPNTMTKLRRDEEVTLGVLGKICRTLDVDYGICEGLSTDFWTLFFVESYCEFTMERKRQLRID